MLPLLPHRPETRLFRFVYQCQCSTSMRPIEPADIGPQLWRCYRRCAVPRDANFITSLCWHFGGDRTGDRTTFSRCHNALQLWANRFFQLLVSMPVCLRKRRLGSIFDELGRTDAFTRSVSLRWLQSEWAHIPKRSFRGRWTSPD